MNKEELRLRTRAFALRVLKLIRALPKEIGAKAVAGQLVRSGMSVGANYRASLRGRSRAEWLSKLNTCLEESDECEYWMELIIEDEMLPAERVTPFAQGGRRTHRNLRSGNQDRSRSKLKAFGRRKISNLKP